MKIEYSMLIIYTTKISIIIGMNNFTPDIFIFIMKKIRYLPRLRLPS